MCSRVRRRGVGGARGWGPAGARRRRRPQDLGKKRCGFFLSVSTLQWAALGRRGRLSQTLTAAQVGRGGAGGHRPGAARAGGSGCTQRARARRDGRRCRRACPADVPPPRDPAPAPALASSPPLVLASPFTGCCSTHRASASSARPPTQIHCSGVPCAVGLTPILGGAGM